MQKPELCALTISTLFTLMQQPNVTVETKNLCAQCLVQIVNIDVTTFKEVAQSGERAGSISYLGPQEKTVIQSLMMRLKQANQT